VNEEDRSVADVPIRAFVSYARSDDSDFGFVEPIMSKLRALVKIKSGRELEIFLDRKDIGWGDDWRDRLSEAVQTAFVFLPLVTATYLDRPHCRDEFLTFLGKARTLGVTELLLPIVPFGSPLISPDSSDEIVLFVESHQYKCLEEGILAGYDSPTWLTIMSDLATSLLTAVAAAESSLLVAPADSVETVTGERDRDRDNEDDLGDSQGLSELMLEMHTAIERMTNEAELLGPAIEALGEVAGSAPDVSSMTTPQQFNAWAFRLADHFKQPAKDLEIHGKELFVAAQRLDQTMRLMQDLAVVSGSEGVAESIESGVQQVADEFSGLESIEAVMEQLLQSMRPAEVFSVAIRKALRPARTGLTGVRDSLRLLRSWGAADELTSE
jgi:hypothetical protein